MAVFAFLLGLMPAAYAQPLPEEAEWPEIEEILQDMDTSAWEDMMGLSRDEVIDRIRSILSGELHTDSLWDQLGRAFTDSIKVHAADCLALIVWLTAVRFMMQWVHSTYRDRIARIPGMVSAVFLGTLLAEQLVCARKTLMQLFAFLQGAQAVTAALALTMGAEQTAATYLADSGLLTGLLERLVLTLILPCWSALALLRLSGLFVRCEVLRTLGDVMTGIGRYLMTFACACAVAWMKFRMGTASAADTLTRRTLRIVSEQGLPVVGGYIRDMVDTTLHCAGLVQTALGSLSLAAVLAQMLGIWMQMLAVCLCAQAAALSCGGEMGKQLQGAAHLQLLLLGITVLAAFWTVFCLGQCVEVCCRYMGAIG